MKSRDSPDFAHIYTQTDQKSKQFCQASGVYFLFSRWWNQLLLSSVDKQFKRKQRDTYMGSWHEILIENVYLNSLNHIT